MTSSPETVEPDESAGQAAVLMIHGGFRHLPVVSDGAVVGMISIRDLVRLTSRTRRRGVSDAGAHATA